MDGTALIVDDSVSIRMQLKRLLIARGFGEVLEAGTVAQATEVFRLRQPAFVFLDLVLPDFPGIIFLARTLESAPETIVVLVTALDREDESVLEAMAQGARGYVRKPVSVPELDAALKAVRPP